MKTTNRMMNRIWFVLAAAAGAALLAMAAPSASAQEQPKTVVSAISPTNAVPGLATESTNVGSPVAVNNDTSITLETTFRETTNSAATGGNVTFTFVTSTDGSNWETAPKLSWVLKSGGTNAATALRARTNFTIGATRWLKLESIASSASNNIAPGVIYVNQIPR